MPENLWFILLVVAASIVRWLWQKSQEEGKDEPERPVVPDQPIPRASETQSEEDRIRRFLEALGQPPGTTPPPKVTPKRRVQPTMFPTLPPLTTTPPPLPPELAAPVAAAPPPLPMPERIFTPAVVEETVFEVRDVGTQTSSEPSPYGRRPAAPDRATLRGKLASPQGLREAIILREIFGPPRSQQPLDLVGS